MNVLKKLMIALVCMTFTLSAACSDDDEKNRNNTTNNTQLDTGGQDTDNEDQDTGGQDTDNEDQDTGGQDTGGQDTGGQDTDNDTDETPDTLTVETFVDEVNSLMAKHQCTMVFNCPENVDPFAVEFLGRAGDEESCIQIQINDANDDTTTQEIAAAVDAERALFDPAEAANCLTAINEYIDSCTPLDEAVMIECMQKVLIPKQAIGDVCVNSQECIDSRCNADEEGEESETCYGSCVANYPAAGEGESCEESYCASGLICDFSSTYTCVKVVIGEVDDECDNYIKQCKTGLICNEEEACAPAVYLDQDAACGNDTTCKAGLTCVGTINEEWELEGTCQPILQEGDDCLSPMQCAIGLHCNATDIDEPGKCYTLKAVGEACDVFAEVPVYCKDDLECVEDEATSTSTCQEREDNENTVCLIPEG